MFMNIMANIDTKRTIIIWFLFSSRYLGAFENNSDVYVDVIILFLMDEIFAKLILFFDYKLHKMTSSFFLYALFVFFKKQLKCLQVRRYS